MNSEKESDAEIGNEEIIEDSTVPSPSKITAASKRITSSTPKATGERKVKRLRKKRVKEEHNPIVKYGSLFLLVAQMVGLVLLMRYSRTNSASEDLYLASTAVFLMEVSFFLDQMCHTLCGYLT